MSRVGKLPIQIPNGVTVTQSGGKIQVKGPKGQLERTTHPTVDVAVEGNVVQVTPKKPLKEYRRYHGLTRSLINNMVVGVSTGFTKRLTLIGVGYRAQAKGKGITLTLGYSHPIEFDPPEGIEVKVEKTTTVIVSGANKEDVGQVAATIRGYRPPEPYHGKGVRYEDERIVTKVGKSGAKK